MKRQITKLIAASLIFAAPALDVAGQSTDELRRGFNNPPQSARSQVWWHWMNGNITKDGIRKDMTWMKRIGLGGFHNFDAGTNTPQIVDKRLIYMDDGWKDAFAYATQLADSLGLEMTIASAPGWSATGGPWVEPKDAMKKLVWRTVDVRGGRNVSLQLPDGDNTTGAFQDISPAGRGSASVTQYYDDICILAVKLPETDKTMAELGATVTSSAGTFSLEQLTDGRLKDKVMLPKNDDGDASWIQYEFPKDVTIRSLTLDTSGNRIELQSSTDGKTFTTVCPIRKGSLEQVTLNIPPTTARYFRLVIANPRASQGLFGAAPAAPGTEIGEWVLYTSTRVDRAEDKAGFTAASGLQSSTTADNGNEEFAQTKDVIDITSCVDASGHLTWKAPKGKWRIFRMGFSLTGKQNHPAPPEATGLEVDKLDSVAWSKYFHTYLDMYKDASEGLMGQHGIQYVLTDSYEAEQENWTPAMFAEFSKRRGYDLHAWMPALTGMVIGSPKQTDAFLRDWRQTIGELLADRYTEISEIVKRDYGMKGRYTESHEGGRAFVGDGMDLKRTAEVPMSAMWVSAPWLPTMPDGTQNRGTYQMDDHESASVAHIYGQNVAAAESMTVWPGAGNYSFHPGNLKSTADLELSEGINRFVIHESAHQPVDDKVPGLSLMGTGQWFNRHETWAEQAKAWIGYLSRSCYLLQQGKNVADVLLYYGEGSNVTAAYGGVSMPAVPSGYQYDFCNPHALINVLEPDGTGGLVSSLSGAKFKVLWLDRNIEYMSLPVLRKIAALAKAGVVIGGEKPQHPAGMTDNVEEFNRLVDEVWGSQLSNVTTGVPLADVLRSHGVEPDADIPQGVRFLHRTLGNGDIYWINKPSEDYRTVEVSLRTSGRKPMLWHADTGVVEDVTYSMSGGRTTVSIPMVPDDAVFIVLTEPAAATSLTLPRQTEKPVLTIDGPWDVEFKATVEAPAGTTFTTLTDWSKNADKDIKYFSGTGIYTATFTIGKLEGDRQILQLGDVKNIAEVIVNGQNLGIVWKEPYQADVTKVLRQGENTIEIRVTNLWVNRLIGDKQPGAKKLTFVDSETYRADSPLLPSGLLGPVTIVSKTNLFPNFTD